MLEDFGFDGFGPHKRERSEDPQENDARARPQAGFAAELVEAYYVRTSRIEQERERAKGLEIYSLGDLVPFLAARVGATAHHFQLIDGRCVPASFARSNVPLEPPRRPFIAAVLAVLVQGFVLEKSGVHVSVFAFDTWFVLVSRTDGAPISRCWLEAKTHVANCIANKERIPTFGQGIIWKQFSGLCGLHSLRDKVAWMIRASVSNRNAQTNCSGCMGFASSTQAMLRTGENMESCVSKESLIWPMWSETFLSLCGPNISPVDQDQDIAECLLSQGVENCVHFIGSLTDVISGEVVSSGVGDCLPSDLYLLCGGTSGEFAAIFLFSALKHTLNAYCSTRPMTKRDVELSIEVMSKLFGWLIRYFLCVPPSPRHYHLLDACQRLWRASLNSNQLGANSEFFTSRRRERAVSVRQEDVFCKPQTPTYILPKQEIDAATPPPPPTFSACVPNALRSGEKLKILIRCLQLQHKKIARFSCDRVDNMEVRPQACSAKSSVPSLSSETASNSFLGFAAPITWCTLELPMETEEGNGFIERFLRDGQDRLAKRCVDSAIVASIDVNGDHPCFFRTSL